MNSEEAIRYIIESIPSTKVVQNKYLDSYMPSTLVRKAEVYFLRNDGWMIGTPREFAKATYELWKGQWSYFYDTQIPGLILPLDKSC